MQGFFKAIAVIFHPLFMPLYGALIVMNFAVYTALDMDSRTKNFVILLLVVNIVAPAISLGTMYSKKIISDLQITNRKERMGPLILILFYYGVSYFLLLFRRRDIALPDEIHCMILGVIVSVLISLVISQRFKISIHMLGISGTLGAISGLAVNQPFAYDYNEYFWIVILALVAGLVGTSRIYTKNHSFDEIMLGAVIGFIINFLIVRQNWFF